MTDREIVERLRLLRLTMEAQAGTSLCEVEVPAVLVFFDVLGSLGLSQTACIHVLGVDNALRLQREYGIEWEEVA